jgi:alpha-tubulin suppressor-like RCC1 family protein
MFVGDGYACIFASPSLECQRTDDAYDSGEADPPANAFESVAASDAFLCGVTTDGEPLCWGADESGETDIPAGIAVERFVAAYSNTCAIESDGHIACWGNVWTGLNDAPTGDVFIDAAAAEGVACGEHPDGSMACWGEWYTGAMVPSEIDFDWTLPTGPFAALASSSGNLCALNADGSIAGWGTANWGVTSPPTGTGYRDLSVGRDHACAIRPDDEVECWGDLPYWRQHPDGRWTTFTAGPWVDCGIREDGEVDCWGCLLTDPFTCDWDE